MPITVDALTVSSSGNASSGDYRRAVWPRVPAHPMSTVSSRSPVGMTAPARRRLIAPGFLGRALRGHLEDDRDGSWDAQHEAPEASNNWVSVDGRRLPPKRDESKNRGESQSSQHCPRDQGTTLSSAKPALVAFHHSDDGIEGHEAGSRRSNRAGGPCASGCSRARLTRTCRRSSVAGRQPRDRSPRRRGYRPGGAALSATGRN